MEIIATSSKFPWYFQPFGHFHGMEIWWKSTSNLLDTSMTWKFVGSQLPTFGHFHGMEIWWKSTSNLWALSWYGNLMEVNFQPFGHFHGMEICWKSTSNLLDTSMVWKFDGSQLPTFWTLPWYWHFLKICWKYRGHLLEVEISISGEDTITKIKVQGFISQNHTP